MEPLKQSRQDLLHNTHETFTALATYLQIEEPTPGSAGYAIGDCLVYAIQTNTLILKTDSALTTYERKTSDEILRLFVHREILRHQLKQLKRRQTIPSRLTTQPHK
jgi:hypothetical protein